MQRTMGSITYSALGELVHSLLGASATGLEHIKKASLVGAEADNLADEVTNQASALGESL